MPAQKKTTKKTQQVETQSAIANSHAIDLTAAMADIGNLQVEVQTIFANIGTRITNKSQILSDLDKAVTATTERLSELHGIDQELLELETIRNQRQEEEAEFDRQRDLRLREWQEQEAAREKERKRREEEYHYTVSVQRRRDEAAWADQMETKKKEFADREARLSDEETEVASLKSQVDGFDARIKDEVTRAEAIVRATMTREFNHKAELASKDVEYKGQLHQSQVDSLNNLIVQLRTQNADLQNQLQTSREDAKQVATQALRSASGRKVADALQKVVDSREPNGKAK